MNIFHRNMPSAFNQEFVAAIIGAGPLCFIHSASELQQVWTDLPPTHDEHMIIL